MAVSVAEVEAAMRLGSGDRLPVGSLVRLLEVVGLWRIYEVNPVDGVETYKLFSKGPAGFWVGQCDIDGVVHLPGGSR